MEHGELLSQKQVNALEDGTLVVVTWTGGNGPHEYTLRQPRGGPVAAYQIHDGREFVAGALDFVGDAKPRTLVSLLTLAGRPMVESDDVGSAEGIEFGPPLIED